MTDTPPALPRGERTRQAIVDTAYEFFITQGYAATSMRQIAERAGIALGGIYNHYGSKEEIFEALLLERHPYHRILPVLSAAQGETLEEFVKNAVPTLVEEFGKQPELFNLLLTEVIEFKGKHVPMVFEQIFPEAMQIGQRMVSYEGLRPIPVPLLMRSFLAIFFAYFVSDLLLARMPFPEIKESALERFIDIYLHGILEKGGDEPRLSPGEHL